MSTTSTTSATSTTSTETADTARRRPGWTLALASCGLFMTALDNVVVTTALPAIRRSLHGSLSDLEWTVNAYLLAFSCSLLTGAALGERFGRRRMFCVGLGIFTIASALAAVSPSVGLLIAARAVQGAGAAIVMPISLTLVSEAFPPERRGMAIGAWGGVAGLAAAGGSVVGGAVVEGLTWHWIFWLNVPVGLAVIPLALSRLRESYGVRPRLDPIGLVLAGGGFFGIVWGLVRANTIGWATTEVVATIAVGAALVAVCVWWESRAPHPMLSLGMFRSAAFSSANAATFCMYAALFGTLFLMAQFFQIAQGQSALATGVRLLPWTAAAAVVTPIAGPLADRFGNRPFMAGGLVLQAAGFAWVATAASPDAGYLQLGAALTVAGIGIGLVFPTVANEVMASVEPTEIGVASGANSAVRELGGVFGVAVLSAVFARRGGYGSPTDFVDGFQAAIWMGAAASVVGAAAATSTLRRRATGPAVPLPAGPAVQPQP